MALSFLLICAIILSNQIEAAKILAVFPIPSISHQVVFRPLTQELARRGHKVTVITTDPVLTKGEVLDNLTEIDVHDISYKIWADKFMSTAKGNKGDILTQIDITLDALVLLVDTQLKDANVKNMIRNNEHFDLLILEACMRSALAYSYIYKAPLILMSSFGAAMDNYQVVGAPIHPLLYPAVSRQRLYNLSLYEKITEVYTQFKTDRLYDSKIDVENAMLQKHFGPDIPSVTELSNNVDMLFLNVHPVFEGIRPVPPSVVYMGGLHQKPEKELPEDLKTYLDSSKHGVIYLSFGTNVDPSLLPADRLQVLVRTFSRLPYDVLWKWNKDELPGRSKNIKISKWLPQSDLLKHPKIKLFITQGGLQSTDEAITAGVPLIGVPMLGDQWYNVQKYEYHKIGIGVDMETLTEEKLNDTINTVINDISFRQNIIKLRSIMKDAVQTPLERAVWWTEYVLRHGGAKHLRAPAANITWSQYLELDLLLVILASLLTVLAILIYVLNFIFKLFRTNYSNVKIKRS